jgi:myo-inositol-1(or 4)-monophosphatase
MENFSWLSAFKEIGAKVRSEMDELFKGKGYGRALGKGAGGDTTLVLDKKAEDAILGILEKLNAAGEQFTFISEELGEKEFGREDSLILADPIDGSNNAKYGIPFFSTALVMANGRKLSDVGLGYIINLGNGDEFWAIRGGGAYKNGIRLMASDRVELGMVNIEASSPRKDLQKAMPLLSCARKVRCLGSTALDLACLAAGATDAVLVPSASRSFDFAAGWLMVKEAGGMVTDLEGNPLDDIPLGLERSTPFIGASNKSVLAKALQALKGCA